MSKVAIAGNASGTGTFTIAAPNSNTDRTLTLPDEAGTVLTSSSTISGSIIQIEEIFDDGTYSTTTSEIIGDGTLTFTPLRSDSTVLIFGYAQGYAYRSATTDNDARAAVRGITLNGDAGGFVYINSNVEYTWGHTNQSSAIGAWYGNVSYSGIAQSKADNGDVVVKLYVVGGADPDAYVYISKQKVLFVEVAA